MVSGFVEPLWPSVGGSAALRSDALFASRYPWPSPLASVGARSSDVRSARQAEAKREIQAVRLRPPEVSSTAPNREEPSAIARCVLTPSRGSLTDATPARASIVGKYVESRRSDPRRHQHRSTGQSEHKHRSACDSLTGWHMLVRTPREVFFEKDDIQSPV